MLEFSQLLSAVKKSERSDKYVILAALYCLGADHSAVTTKQVRELLSLHLGNKIPSNIAASLSAYTGYVGPHSKGPPRTWKLTAKGLAELRALSGLGLATESETADFDFDVGIVCALEQPEQIAIQDAFGGAAAWEDVGDARFPHLYKKMEFQTANGEKLRMVSVTATAMGLTAAAIATTHLVLQFKPRLVIMPGIAAGTKDGDKQFGDVLVADPSVDYNSGKVTATDGIPGFQPDPYPIGLHMRLRSVLQKYRAFHPTFQAIREKWEGTLPSGKNRLHIGPLGAADQVIEDPSKIIEIRKNWRKLIGVEMETYGVYRACNEAPEPKPRFLSFKAVCDFAADKTDSWQPFAAYVAAEFTAAFLRDEWANLWPTTIKQE